MMKTNRTDAPSPPIQERVHVVPMGFEEDRVVMPAIKMKAEQVVLVANRPEVDQAGEFRGRVIRRLRARGIRSVIEIAPIFKLDETVDVLLKILRSHRADSLSINISAGSKIQALAGLLAAMIARTDGISVTVYYAEPEKYRENPPRRPLSFGLRQIVVLPPLILPTPPMEVKAAMQRLADREFSKLELAVSLASDGHLDNSKLDGFGKPRNERARVGLQASVDQRVVQPLIRLGYATTQKRGRRVFVSLTDLGRQTARVLTAGMISEVTARTHHGGAQSSNVS